MHFELSQDQRDIKQTARKLLADRVDLSRMCEPAGLGALDLGLYAELAEYGWPGVAVDERYGGTGLGLVELAILIEEHGYALAPSPLVGTVSAAAVIGGAGSEDQKNAWLPGLAAGAVRGAVGSADLIPDGVGADVVVIVDGDDALIVDPAQVLPVATLDPTRGYAHLAQPPTGERLPGDVRVAVAAATVVAAAELVGVSQRALDMTVAYVGQRKQFGRAVGSFQAVAHRCTEMLLATEAARSATYYGAWAADADAERAPEAAAVAKALASGGAQQVTGSAIQAHGGIGFTWEADLHWFYKRAQLGAVHLGAGRSHRARLVHLAAERLRQQAGTSASDT